MLQKINWRAVQLIALMFLLLFLTALDGPGENGNSGKHAEGKKTDAPGKTRAGMPLLAKE